MTETVTLETKFIVPDEMDEENVRHVLSQFFGDLVRTDRFIDARIVDDESLGDVDGERLLDQLSTINDADLEQLDNFIDALEDE